MEIASEITRVLEEKAGIAPSATTVMFVEVAPSDWVVAGRPYATPAIQSNSNDQKPGK